MNFKTYTLKKSDIKKKWFLIDAKDLIVGRLAVFVTNLLRGKHKASYSPHIDCGDNVIIVNADLVRFTGSKFKKKIYYKHTGFVGGLKECTPHDLEVRDKNERIIKLAIQRMMGLNGPLSRKRMKNLYVYKGEAHDQIAQKPIKLDFQSFSKKNTLANS
jgi:large subunit ribosomal protein L13